MKSEEQKRCQREKMRRWRAVPENKAKEKARRKKAYWNNTNGLRGKMKSYYEENKKHLIKKQKEYQAKNPQVRKKSAEKYLEKTMIRNREERKDLKDHYIVSLMTQNSNLIQNSYEKIQN